MMVDNPFCFRQDPIAKRLRLIRDARKILAMAEDGQRHQPFYSSTEGQLGKLYLCLTFSCPLHCPFCQADAGVRRSKELGPDRILKITQDAVSAGFREIVVTGGEPLVYSGIDKLMRSWGEMDKGRTKFILRTSFGFSVSHNRIRMIARAFDEITVSIDGDEQRHDSIRGKGVYRLALSNINACLREQSAVINLASVMEKEDFEGEAGRAVEALRQSLGIKKWVVRSPLPLGRGDCKQNCSKPPFEWRTSDAIMPTHLEPKFSCGFGKNVYMEPNGVCYPCYVWCRPESKLGDLAGEDLSDIIAGKEMLACMNCGVDTNAKCRECSVRYFCGGGCKLFYQDKKDVNCGDFDCSEAKARIIENLSHLDEMERNLTEN